MRRGNDEPRRRTMRRAGAVLIAAACGAAGAVGAMLAAGGDGGQTRRAAGTSTTMDAAALRRAAAAAGVPVYWVGPRAGMRYTLQTAERSAYVRYVADEAASSFTVASYAMEGGYADLAAAAARSGSSSERLPNGGLAVFERARPTSVYVGYPGLEAQIEVFSPRPGDAWRAVTQRSVRPVADGSEAPVKPFVATPAELRSIARTPGSEPIYWAGTRPGTRLEVTRTADGTVFVRYLPRGVQPGDRRGGLLTVASYPRADAFADVLAATERPGARRFEAPAGGVGVLERGARTNFHLAFPGVARQIEVYGATTLDILALGRTGQIERLR